VRSSKCRGAFLMLVVLDHNAHAVIFIVNLMMLLVTA
jgi:hypothetical protein